MDTEIARAELTALLPARLRAQLDFDALSVESSDLLDPDLSARLCDVLYRAPSRLASGQFLWLLSSGNESSKGSYGPSASTLPRHFFNMSFRPRDKPSPLPFALRSPQARNSKGWS